MSKLHYSLLLATLFNIHLSYGMFRTLPGTGAQESRMSVAPGKGDPRSFTRATRPSPSFSTSRPLTTKDHFPRLAACALTTGGLGVPVCMNSVTLVTGTTASEPSLDSRMLTEALERKHDVSYIDSSGKKNTIEVSNKGAKHTASSQKNYVERRTRDR